MSDARSSSLVTRQVGYFAMCLAIILLALIPVNLHASRWVGPDLLYCLTMALIVRRPRHTPFWLIALVFLLADIMFMKPLGIGTLTVLIATEIVRNNKEAFREYPFLVEWFMVSMLFAVCLIAQLLLLTLLFAPSIGLLAAAKLLISTSVAYPLVVGFMYFILRLRKPVPGQANSLGQRL